MRRRIIAAFLSMVMLLSCLLSMSGCAAQVEDKLTLGQWLGMINQSFGMDTYVSDEPYFQDVGTGDSLFGTVQAAAEWGVVEEAEELHPEQTLTWRSALVTLVNAGGFLPEETTESDKIGYALEHFATGARSYWMDREISQASAEEALETAVNQWQTFTYDTPVEKVDYSEDTVDLSQGDKKVTDYQMEDDTVILPEEVAEEIQPGDIYVLPAGDGSMGTQAFRAESVTQKNGKTYITNDPQEPELTDFVENLDLQQTIVPDLENMEVFDGNGNLVSSGSAVQQDYTEEPQIENMDFRSEKSPKAQKMAATTLNKTFSTPNGFKVSFNISSSKDNFSMGASITYALGKKDKDSDDKSELKAGIEISNLSITQETEVKWFVPKSARLQVNYQTKNSFGAEFGSTPVNRVKAPYDNRNSSFLSNLKNSAFKDRDAKGAKTIASRKTIKICSMNIYNAGVAKVCLDVAFKISLSGSFTFTITERGSKGIEYKNGNFRKISEESEKDIDFLASGKVEGTLSIGPALYVVGLKKKVMGLALEFGAGASATGKLHLADEENHLLEEADAGDNTLEAYGSIAGYDLKATPSVIQEIAKSQGGTYNTSASEVKLRADLCIDVRVYGIVKIGLDDNAYFGGGGKVSFEIFGKDNATLGSIHIDCPGCNFMNAELHMGKGASASDQCIFKYSPFDGEEESSSSSEEGASGNSESSENSESSDNSSSSNAQEETLILEHLELTLEKGESGKVAIKSLPDGVKMSDLVFTSADPEIVQVDQSGNVKALKSGATVVSVETKDGAHHVQCSIIVMADKEEFEGLGTGSHGQTEVRC